MIHLEPADEFNQTLVSHLHPDDWTNPVPKDRYHLVVIGAGPGGLICAAGAAGLGAKVALIERGLMGGDCLNVGCIPSKAVIRAARGWHDAQRAHEQFGGPAVSGAGDFGEAMARMRRLRAHLSRHDSVRRFRDELGVDVFLGHGRFAGPDAVEVDGHRLHFRRAVIATGARAAALPTPGLEETGYLTNETVFSLTDRPEHLLVIGAGPIGCELAQSFARFGARVTVLDQADHILPREDPDAAHVVERAMIRDGVEYVSNVKITAAERRGDTRVLRAERDGREVTFEGDQILVAVGRTPNIDGLGLEAAGVAIERRRVKVDDRLRTANKRVYAVGDVCSAYPFTHTADAQARIVIANALFFGRGRASRLVVPWCTYTSPEIAHVGLYEAPAQQAGYQVDTITVPLADVDRAVIDGDDEGFLRVHLKQGTDRILGATLVAEHAGDMIGELALAITAKTGLGAIGRTIHPYPTTGEVIRKAADAWRRRKLTPRTKRLFELFFRLVR